MSSVCSSGRHPILREFLTLPLLLAASALIPYRRRLLLVCAHNVQRAVGRWRDRLAINALAALGFRFVIPESSEGLAGRGLGRLVRASFVLPLGVGPEHEAAPHGPKGEFLVGVIGKSRKEKGGAAEISAIRAAVRATGLPARLLVGRPGGDPADASEGIETVDTTDPADYRAALARCHVVVLPYARSDYEFRPSATIVDAIAAHAAVVCPDYPVFRAQISAPATVGVAYRDDDSLPAAIARAARLSAGGSAPFEQWLAHRSRAAIARRLTHIASDLA